jgi:WD40 repeat protein
VRTILVFLLGCVHLFATPASAQSTREVLERCKRAIALVEVTRPNEERTGTAFCVDPLGIFITPSELVGDDRRQARGNIRLVLDSGLPTQRVRRAFVVRTDERLKLALLKVDDGALTALEAARDEQLAETAPVLSLSFPLGREAVIGETKLPELRSVASRITSLRRDQSGLQGVQFDGKIDAGAFGGPVIDESGRLVGIAAATIPGAAMNLAIPPGQIAGFLQAPGILFQPPPVRYADKLKPVTWDIQLLPTGRGAKLSEALRVYVLVTSDCGYFGPLESVLARAVGGGKYRVEVTPVIKEPVRRVVLNVTPTGKPAYIVQIDDREIQVGTRHFLLGDLKEIYPAPANVVITAEGKRVQGVIARLGQVQRDVGKETVNEDLNRATVITVSSGFLPLPVSVIEAWIEVYEGKKLLVKTVKSVDLLDAPPRVERPMRPAPSRRPLQAQLGADDKGLLQIGGLLNGDGRPRGAGKTIRPPTLPIGRARTGAVTSKPSKPELRRLAGHTNEVMDLVLSPDGRRLISCDQSGVLRIWQVKDGLPLHVLKEHKGAVYALAISPDGQQVLSGGADKILRLWDVEEGRLIQEYPGHRDGIYAVAFARDGGRALSAGGAGPGFAPGTDHDIWVRDLKSGKVLTRWSGHTGIIDALAVTTDGKMALSAASDATARLWDVAKGRELHQFPGQKDLDLHAIFTPDGRRAIVASEGPVIRVFDVATYKEQLTLRGHTKKIDSLATTRDGRILASGSWPERVLRFWDLADGRPLGQIDLEANPQLGVFEPDGEHLLWAFSDRTIREFSVPESVALALRPDPAAPPGEPLVCELGGKIRDIAVGGEGRFLLLVLKEPRELAIFDVNAAAIVKRIPLASDGVLLAAGATEFVVADTDRNTLERWSLATLTSRASGPSNFD